MTPGKYLFIVSSGYIVIGIIDLFIFKFCPIEAIQLSYPVILSLPLFIRPIARWVGIKPLF